MKALPGALGRPWDDGTRWRVAFALAAGTITLRALVFIVFEQSYFDADQAVFGLMALHPGEGLVGLGATAAAAFRRPPELSQVRSASSFRFWGKTSRSKQALSAGAQPT